MSFTLSVFNAPWKGERGNGGDVVAPDNLGAHRPSRLEKRAASRGVQVLWLAPYSLDFSPIE